MKETINGKLLTTFLYCPCTGGIIAIILYNEDSERHPVHLLTEEIVKMFVLFIISLYRRILMCDKQYFDIFPDSRIRSRGIIFCTKAFTVNFVENLRESPDEFSPDHCQCTISGICCYERKEENIFIEVQSILMSSIYVK